MERLHLLPTEHRDGDNLKGVSVYVYKDHTGFIGNFTCDSLSIERVVDIVSKHLSDSGYKTITYLYGELIEREAS